MSKPVDPLCTRCNLPIGKWSNTISALAPHGLRHLDCVPAALDELARLRAQNQEQAGRIAEGVVQLSGHVDIITERDMEIAELQQQLAEAAERETASYRYACQLFTALHPECTLTDDTFGVLMQIDNAIVGYCGEIASLRTSAGILQEAHIAASSTFHRNMCGHPEDFRECGYLVCKSNAMRLEEAELALAGPSGGVAGIGFARYEAAVGTAKGLSIAITTLRESCPDSEEACIGIEMAAKMCDNLAESLESEYEAHLRAQAQREGAAE